jgi:hypothetical protein
MTVAERRQLFDAAMTSVGQAAAPQTDAAIKLVAWISRGMMRPTPEDFAMLRLILLALLPQIGGMLLLIRRRSLTTAVGASDQNGAPAGAVPCPFGAVAVQPGSGRSTSPIWGPISAELSGRGPVLHSRKIVGWAIATAIEYGLTRHRRLQLTGTQPQGLTQILIDAMSHDAVL